MVVKRATAPHQSQAKIRTLHLLQIGDVHYPDWDKVQVPVDVKDRALASSIRESVSIHPIQLVLRELAYRLHRQRYDLVAVMGDLTSRGDINKYEQVLAQLSALLDVKRLNKSRKRVVLVPGNHDIDRTVALNDGIDAKFSKISEAAVSFGWPKFPIRELSRIDIDNCVTAFLLNTCLGCGEKRLLPEVVRDAIVESVSKAINNTSDNASGEFALDEYYEQLDTPALDEAAVRRLNTDLRGLNKSHLPILIAHHNLLPQREPRFAPYSELLNGGQIRRALTQTDRPILYLHGHIHDDPIEIINDASYPSSKLISISAPALEAGFNEIIVYITADGRPCGCRVKPFRLNQAAGVAERQVIDLALGSVTDRIRSQLAYNILNLLTKNRKTFWRDLKDALPSKPRPFSEDEIEATLMELYFASYVRIDSIELPRIQWRIEIG